jgi:hypothetical protein
LIGLFLLNEMAALALLVTEIVPPRNWMRRHPIACYGDKLALFVEALAIDHYVLLQFRMEQDTPWGRLLRVQLSAWHAASQM